ncbi:hypothetical protein JVU11DRAFT_10315 [Chiua virens]|nr:hypothetical protein JVU11DRAFT_10315 [Chiua virens]
MGFELDHLSYFYKAVRMSLLYSIIRTMPTSSVLRKFSRILAVLFILCWATTIGLKIWRCPPSRIQTSPIKNNDPMCIVGFPQSIVLVEVITDCISDTALVVLPLRLLWSVKLPPRQRPNDFMLILVKRNHIDIIIDPCNLSTNHSGDY